MTTIATVIAIGFFLGMRHATDPDHVVAVTTIVSRQRSIRQAAFIGILWGIGHTITIFLVGAAIILFGLVIPPRVGLTMELSVGLMLIALGLLNLTGVMRWAADRWTPAHFHPHKPTLGLFQTLRPLAIGLVHGLAGSAAVALLVLATIHVPATAVIYLLVFGIGTIAGMMLITAAIAMPFTLSLRFTNLNRTLGVASGVVSLCFGLFVVYQMGYASGLFTHNPIWIPR